MIFIKTNIYQQKIVSNHLPFIWHKDKTRQTWNFRWLERVCSADITQEIVIFNFQGERHNKLIGGRNRWQYLSIQSFPNCSDVKLSLHDLAVFVTQIVWRLNMEFLSHNSLQTESELAIILSDVPVSLHNMTLIRIQMITIYGFVWLTGPGWAGAK